MFSRSRETVTRHAPRLDWESVEPFRMRMNAVLPRLGVPCPGWIGLEKLGFWLKQSGGL